MEKLYEFESLVFRIRKLENEKIRTKSKYHRLNIRVHFLKAKKEKLRKAILREEVSERGAE